MIHSTIYYQLELKFQKYPVAMIEKAQLKNAQKANFRTLDREPIVMPKKFVHMNVGMRRQNRGLWAGRLFSNIRDIT